ncbi:hypothetical protein Tco_1015401 [Tanacetum coccineum]|uniref:Uncharacterized protein n=1 Tax=Tanacetum coccineum TaxID=301880 RepID=A0ABQ5FKN5_9ASTR
MSSVLGQDGVHVYLLVKPMSYTLSNDMEGFQPERLEQILDSRGAIPSKTAADAKERGFGSLPSSTKANPRDQVKSISTTIEADSYPILRIGSSQYAISTGQNRTLMYKTRQMTIPFLSRLNDYYCEEKKGSYGPQF